MRSLRRGAASLLHGLAPCRKIQYNEATGLFSQGKGSKTMIKVVDVWRVLSGGLELKLLRPGNTMAPALVGYQRYATKIAGEPPCKLTGDHKLVKTSDDDERMMKNSNLTEEALKVRHEEWMNKFNREYKDEAEKAYRFEMFKSTVRFAEKFNAEQVKEHGYCKSILGTTQFADLTLEEFGHWVDGRRDTFGPPKVTKFD
uniref:Cathepsin propeptide inhibitor domain-containing protein n=1 Tax=Oryza meridionalis TaxID=40149 RepID=A0A0E0E6T7_9ORYZ